MKLKIFSLLSLLFLGSGIKAQEIWTLQDVFGKVLQNNFDILISKKNIEVSDNLLSNGKAKQLPALNITSGGNYSNNNTQLKFAGGFPDTDIRGAQSFSYNGAIGFNYQLFGGFGVVKNIDKLKTDKNISQVQARLTIENALISSNTAVPRIIESVSEWLNWLLSAGDKSSSHPLLRATFLMISKNLPASSLFVT